MARAKQAVDLANGKRPVGSRIRRDPPPPPEKVPTPSQVREREAWLIVTGITAFAVALAVIMTAFGQWTEKSPADTNIVIESF